MRMWRFPAAVWCALIVLPPSGWRCTISRLHQSAFAPSPVLLCLHFHLKTGPLWRKQTDQTNWTLKETLVAWRFRHQSVIVAKCCFKKKKSWIQTHRLLIMMPWCHLFIISLGTFCLSWNPGEDGDEVLSERWKQMKLTVPLLLRSLPAASQLSSSHV